MDTSSCGIFVMKVRGKVLEASLLIIVNAILCDLILENQSYNTLLIVQFIRVTVLFEYLDIFKELGPGQNAQVVPTPCRRVTWIESYVVLPDIL